MSDVNLSDLGLGKVCRACLSDEGEMKSVFSLSSDCPDIQIFKMFECCASLEIRQNDGLPAVICLQCELRLHMAYNFRELCQRSNISLRKYIENAMRYNVKNENVNEVKYIIDQIEPAQFVEIDDNDDKNDDTPESNDDDSPVVLRGKTVQFTETVVEQAIEENKKKFNEKQECRICGFIASNSRGLSLHISHCHKDLKEKWCKVCYKEVNDLELHSKEHSTVKSFSCTFCEKSFSSQGHLTEHIRSHSLERPYKCNDCNKGFLSSRHLKVHERIHSGEKPFTCSQCGRGFTQKGSLQSHIRTHTGFKPFKCENCDKQCATSSALAIHRSKTGHDKFTKIRDPDLVRPSFKPYKCEICGKTCATSSSLAIHRNKTGHDKFIKIRDPNVEKPEFEEVLIVEQILEEHEADNQVKDDISTQPQLPSTTEPTSSKEDPPRKLCTVCGKTFSTASKLRLHMRVHTGETPYKCGFCAKRFSTRGQLVVHVRTHTGEKPHVCHVCGKGFAQSSVLNTHMKLHTGRPEQCQVCQQRFCRPAELRLHMRKHTGEKPYLCTECGQTFIQRSHLMEHIKIHSDERPYKCHLCERAFKQSSSLKSHIQIHTGFKPYKCSQCPYACRQPYSLTQHMKQHSQDTPQPNRPHICLVCHKGFTTMAMLSSHSRTVHQAVFN